MRTKLLGTLLAALIAPVAMAAEYRADLGPMPLDDETKAFVAGRGEVTGTIEGDRLSLQGDFRGLPSNATVAHIMLSPVIGVPGTKVLSLRVSPATEGAVSGAYRLTPAQVRALRTGRLYVQIDSAKAPPGYSWGPKGTIWGWLLPAHETTAPGVPQQGHWFLPQLDTPSR